MLFGDSFISWLLNSTWKLTMFRWGPFCSGRGGHRTKGHVRGSWAILPVWGRGTWWFTRRFEGILWDLMGHGMVFETPNWQNYAVYSHPSGFATLVPVSPTWIVVQVERFMFRQAGDGGRERELGIFLDNHFHCHVEFQHFDSMKQRWGSAVKVSSSIPL